MKQQTGHIQITPDSLKELHKAYLNARKENNETFVFQDQELVTDFAQYLLQYVCMEILEHVTKKITDCLIKGETQAAAIGLEIATGILDIASDVMDTKELLQKVRELFNMPDNLSAGDMLLELGTLTKDDKKIH